MQTSGRLKEIKVSFSMLSKVWNKDIILNTSYDIKTVTHYIHVGDGNVDYGMSYFLSN